MNLIDFTNDLAKILKKHGIKDISPMFCLNCYKDNYYDGMDGYAHIRISDNGTLEMVGMKIDGDKKSTEAPTVDAVEVIRCKNCKSWKCLREDRGLCKHPTFTLEDDTIDPLTEPNDFCSYGERKDNAQ